MNITKFDIAQYLDDEETITAYLSSILEDGTPDEFIIALGDIARAKGITELAKQTGLGRESLYKTLSGNSQPRFDTIYKITKALGYQLNLTHP